MGHSLNVGTEMTDNKLKGLTLTDILHAANKHYGEGYLSRYFDAKTGRSRRGSGDTLAQFIVRELSNEFESTDPRDRQIAVATRALQRAQKDLQRAIDGLREL